MNQLTAEQRKKIEDNKKAALLKRKQNQAAQPCQNISSTSTVTSKKKYIKSISSTNFYSEKIEEDGISLSPQFTAVCRIVSNDSFTVDVTYDTEIINIFKTVNGKKYDAVSRKWMFPIKEYDDFMKKINKLNTKVSIVGLPKAILDCCSLPDVDYKNIDITHIDQTLLNTLMPFQYDGIRFGVSRKGRCMLADDMGLGKTVQALGIADYYKKDWPLLIVCPSSMKYPWEEAIQNFLPSVNPFHVSVMVSSKDLINDAVIVIISYDLLKTSLEVLKKAKFGAVILDESHFLKSYKSARTKAALEIIKKSSRVILLSGTPALSRPIELYTQISAIDPLSYRTFHEFGLRYCDGKRDKFGWNFNGCSNMEELDLFLRKKIMIRRLKSDVIKQLPSKLRKVIILHPDMIKSVTKQFNEYANKLESQKGTERRSTLLSYYCATGNAKLKAVCEYILDKLECTNKFLVFAHHTAVLDGVCELLMKKKVDFVRIDGSTSAESRKINCDTFQTMADCRVAVLSIRAANSGITLTSAQLVIFAELFWNPGELTQAEDRAHRIGQLDSVVIEYLVAKGTADEHIWNLIQNKLDMLNKAGLSKDNFKNSDTEHVTVDKKQQSITSMFQIFEEQPVTDSETNKYDQVLSDFFDSSDQEDVMFANLDLGLDTFDGEPIVEKKRKIN